MSGHRSFVTAIAVLVLASPLGAQDVSQDTSVVNGAAAASTAASVVTRSTPDPLALRSPARAPAWTYVDAGVTAKARNVAPRRFLDRESSQSGALMIVGGAAMLVGAVVSGKTGTVLMLGGGVVGLVGLWRYAR